MALAFGVVAGTALAARPAARFAADFAAGCGCEAFADDKGRLTPTRLHMTSGQQQFLAALGDLALSLLPDGKKRGRQTPAALLEAVALETAGLYAQMEAVYRAGFVDTAAGSALDHVPASYVRYLERSFLEAFKLQGTPLRIQFKSSHNPFASKV